MIPVMKQLTWLVLYSIILPIATIVLFTSNNNAYRGIAIMIMVLSMSNVLNHYAELCGYIEEKEGITRKQQ